MNIKDDNRIKILYFNEVLCRLKLNQQQMAEQLDVTDSYVSTLLKGKKPITKKVINKLKKLSSFSLEDYILQLTEADFFNTVLSIQNKPIITRALSNYFQ